MNKMSVSNNNAFRRIAKFKFNGKFFQMYRDKRGKIAFLEVKDKRYFYPTEKDFKELIEFFYIGTNKKSFFSDGNHKLYNFIPKINKKSKSLIITSSLIMSILSGCNNLNSDYQLYANSYYSYTIDDTKVTSPYDEEEQSEILDGVTVQPSTDCYETEDFDIMKSAQYIQFYNNKYFSDVFGVENRTINEIIDAINSNRELPQDFKDCFIDLVTEISGIYPDFDWRVLYYNLQNLKFLKQNPETISFDTDTVAYYNIDTNTIVVSDEIDIVNNTKDRLVFRHECGHLFNNLNMEKDGWTIKYSFNDSGKGRYVGEAMTVALSTQPYLDEYDTSESMGYPITTNIIKVIVDSLPSYDYDDSISNNIYYLEKKMNEYFDDELDADIVIDLIELQWYEYSSDMIEVDEQEYVDLYKYVTRLYLKANATDDMSYNEIIYLKEQLEERLTAGVKDDSYIYTSVIDEEFENYILENQLEQNYIK